MKDKKFNSVAEAYEHAEKKFSKTEQLNIEGIEEAVMIHKWIVEDCERIERAAPIAREALQAFLQGDVVRGHQLSEQIERTTYGSNSAPEKFTEEIRDYKMDSSLYYQLTKDIR